MRRHLAVRIGTQSRVEENQMMKTTNICSIFGQIESVVADQMVAEGHVHRISVEDIPPTARYNDAGEIAHCALVFTPEMERLFDQRVRNLRA